MKELFNKYCHNYLLKDHNQTTKLIDYNNFELALKEYAHQENQPSEQISVERKVSGQTDIEKWCHNIIHDGGGFQSMEYHEFAVFKDRDVAIVEFTIRCLANTDNENSKMVLDSILARRKEVDDKRKYDEGKRAQTMHLNSLRNTWD